MVPWATHIPERRRFGHPRTARAPSHGSLGYPHTRKTKVRSSPDSPGAQPWFPGLPTILTTRQLVHSTIPLCTSQSIPAAGILTTRQLVHSTIPLCTSQSIPAAGILTTRQLVHDPRTLCAPGSELTYDVVHHTHRVRSTHVVRAGQRVDVRRRTPYPSGAIHARCARRATADRPRRCRPPSTAVATDPNRCRDCRPSPKVPAAEYRRRHRPQPVP